MKNYRQNGSPNLCIPPGILVGFGHFFSRRPMPAPAYLLTLIFFIQPEPACPNRATGSPKPRCYASRPCAAISWPSAKPATSGWPTATARTRGASRWARAEKPARTSRPMGNSSLSPATAGARCAWPCSAAAPFAPAARRGNGGPHEARGGCRGQAGHARARQRPGCTTGYSSPETARPTRPAKPGVPSRRYQNPLPARP